MNHAWKLARALACATALSAICAAPALGLTNGLDIPTGGAPSPLFGAQPFTQPLGLFEEFGTQAMPTTSACANCTPMPATSSCFGVPNGPALDSLRWW